MTTIAIADDHRIFCDSVASLINDTESYKVIWTAQNGEEAIARLNKVSELPDVLLLDINMPKKNGLEVAEWLHTNKRETVVLALTMESDDAMVLKMLHYGVKGYLLKNTTAEELFVALQAVEKFGFYYTPIITAQIGNSLQGKSQSQSINLIGRESEILELICTDLSYSEIAQTVCLSESTIDSYRARLFDKFDVKNRVGLLLKAHKMGFVKL
jgi:DNA-binding NarL/FixJ family response regulator